MDILFFGDYWDNMWRRRQQLAWHLVQSDMVKRLIYIERPLPITSFIKFLFGQADRDGIDRWRRIFSNRSWIMSRENKLSVLTTFAPLPPINPTLFFQISEWIRDRWLINYLRTHFNLNRPGVWISHPQLSIKVIQALNPSLLWYDCTEDFMAWPGLSNCMRAQIKKTDRWLSKHADVVTTVSHILYEEKKQINPNTHWLPNAVDVDIFLKPQENFPIPEELRYISRPVLTFVGGLSEWAHDWHLLHKVATLRPKWTILLIGNLKVKQETYQMLKSHSNILCIGQKAYKKLPDYLAHSDVCFQFYRPVRGNNSRNSQKLFLYFAIGKPVVSTPSADVETYADFVRIVETAQDFVVGVEQVIKEDSSRAVWLRQNVARDNSWSLCVHRVLQILNNKRIF